MDDNFIPVVHDCDKCERMCKVRTQIVNGAGKPGARIAFVMANPGPNEDAEGKPLVGRYSLLLKTMCDAAHIPLNATYRTNAVRCLTPGKAKPTTAEIDNCRDYLIDELRALSPDVIVTMGEVPLTSLWGKRDDGSFTREMDEYLTRCEMLDIDYNIDLAQWAGMTPKERKAAGIRKPNKPKYGKKPKKKAAKKVTIKDVAGFTLIQPELNIPMIATYAPGYLTSNKWSQAPQVIAHLEKAWRIANGMQEEGTLGDYHTIADLDELRGLEHYLLSNEVETIWFDTETTGLDWQYDELLCISFAGRKGEGFVVPILENVGDGELDLYKPWWDCWPKVLKSLKRIFASSKPKGGHNVLFDLRILERDSESPNILAATAYGIRVNGKLIDTELEHHAVAEGIPHNMTNVLALETDMPFYEDDIKHMKKQMNKVENEVLWAYSAADADGLPRIHEKLRPRLEAEGVDWVLDNVTVPMLRVCREIEDNGFPIDIDYFNALCDFYALEIQRHEEELWEMTPWLEPGWKYNYAPTLRNVLFGDLGLPHSEKRKTPGGRGCEDCGDGVCFQHRQTGKDALVEIKEMMLNNGEEPHPILDCIITLKNMTKRHSVYLDGGKGGMRRYIKPDGRIHQSMKISRAETGRLASEKPNGQNIPNYVHIHQIGDTCWGIPGGCLGKGRCERLHDHCSSFYEETFGINTTNAFHDLVRAPKGRGIMNIDWSQLEIWVLAYRIRDIVGDTTLLDILESGVDIHTWMARQMYSDVDPDLDDKAWKAAHPALRRRAKMANFGIGYGLTAEGFAAREGCTLEEAEDAIERYCKIVPIEKYFAFIRHEAARDNVRNEFNRKRHVSYLKILKAMREFRDFESTIRELINFPIQSGGSDLHSVASAATVMLDTLRSRGCRVILSVHDSLTFEFDWPDNEYALQTAWMIKDLWANIAYNLIKPDGEPLNWKVPCEVEYGHTWGTPEFLLDARGNLEDLRESA